MRRTAASFALALVASVPVAIAPARAHAQSAAEIAARRELLNQAQAAARANDHARAAELVERAIRIQASVSVRRFLADELNAGGRIAPALGAAELCVADARRENNRRNAQHQRACETLVTQLTPRVGRVTVQVPQPTPTGLRVRVAGEEINSAFYGVPYVVTPGTVLIEAEAPDHSGFRREVTVSAQGNETVRVEVQRVATAAAGNPTGNNGQGGQADANRPGSVRIIVNPQGGGPAPADMRVTFDGELVSGDPPTIASVAPGEHIVHVTADGFVPVQTSVTIAPGQFRALSLALSRVAAAGSLRVTSPVANAQVLLDGAIVGTVPLQRNEVAAGRHTLEIRATGYRPYQTAIEVQSGHEFTFNADSLVADESTPRVVYRRAHSPIGGILIATGLVAAAGGAGLWAYVPLVYWPTVSSSPSNCDRVTMRCSFAPGRGVNNSQGTLVTDPAEGFRIYQGFANNYTLAGQITLGAGGAIFVLGIVLYFTVTYPEAVPATALLEGDPHDRGRARRASIAHTRPVVTPLLDPTSGVMGLGAAF